MFKKGKEVVCVDGFHGISVCGTAASRNIPVKNYKYLVIELVQRQRGLFLRLDGCGEEDLWDAKEFVPTDEIKELEVLEAVRQDKEIAELLEI